MAPTVTAILSHQQALSAKALSHTHDLNEAGLLVGLVMSHAFQRFRGPGPAEDISDALTRDLDALIEARARH